MLHVLSQLAICSTEIASLSRCIQASWPLNNSSQVLYVLLYWLGNFRNYHHLRKRASLFNLLHITFPTSPRAFFPLIYTPNSLFPVKVLVRSLDRNNFNLPRLVIILELFVFYLFCVVFFHLKIKHVTQTNVFNNHFSLEADPNKFLSFASFFEALEKQH